VNILKLVAQLALDGRGFRSGMREATAASDRFASHLGSSVKNKVAAAFGTAAISAYVKSVASAAMHTKDVAEQYRISTDEVQELGNSARRTGLDVNEMTAALEKSGDARKSAAEGNTELRQAWARFGVTLQDLQNPLMRDLDLMKKVGEAAKGMSIGAVESAALRDLFGSRRGGRIAAALQDFGGGRKPGDAIISNDDIERIDQAAKKLEMLWLRLKSIGAGPIADVIGQAERGVGKFEAANINARVGAILQSDKNLTPEERKNLIAARDGAMGAFDDGNGQMNPAAVQAYRDALASINLRVKQQNPVATNGDMQTVDASGFEAQQNERLYKDQLEKAALDDLKKAHAEYRNAVMDAALKKMSASDALIAKQKELKRIVDDVAELESIASVFGTDPETESYIFRQRALAEKMGADIFGDAKGLAGGKPSMLSVDSLTAAGQLGGGRNIVVSGSADQTAKEALKVAKETEKILRSIDSKTKPGQTFNAAL
jgi:hypothetical protein